MVGDASAGSGNEIDYVRGVIVLTACVPTRTLVASRLVKWLEGLFEAFGPSIARGDE